MPPAPPPPDGGVAPDALLVVSQGCIDVGSHVAEILIADAKDPMQKAALEQERAKIVRRSAEACTRDGWSATGQKCFLDAKTSAGMQVCGKNLKAP